MLNWARWARSGDQHDLGAKISSLWRFWLPHKHRDDGWGDPGAAEAMPDPVDAQAAEVTDKALKRIAWQHYNILRRWYYLHDTPKTDQLFEALRALGDELNAKTTQKG